MAYRFKGDPHWSNLQIIYGPREPIDHRLNREVIVLSSEDEEVHEHVMHPQPQHEPHQPTTNGGQQDKQRRVRAQSRSSRNVQRSMWDYVGYASDSEASLTNDASTANSSRTNRYKVHLQLIGCKPPRDDCPTELHSGNSSSQASNDPFGKKKLLEILFSSVIDCGCYPMLDSVCYVNYFSLSILSFA